MMRWEGAISSGSGFSRKLLRSSDSSLSFGGMGGGSIHTEKCVWNLLGACLVPAWCLLSARSVQGR